MVTHSQSNGRLPLLAIGPIGLGLAVLIPFVLTSCNDDDESSAPQLVITPIPVSTSPRPFPSRTPTQRPSSTPTSSPTSFFTPTPSLFPRPSPSPTSFVSPSPSPSPTPSLSLQIAVPASLTQTEEETLFFAVMALEGLEEEASFTVLIVQDPVSLTFTYDLTNVECEVGNVNCAATLPVTIPDTIQAGEYELMIRVEDGQGHSTISETKAVTILPPPSASASPSPSASASPSPTAAS